MKHTPLAVAAALQLHDVLTELQVLRGYTMRCRIAPMEVLAMRPTPELSREEFINQMRKKVEEALGRVADAINEAPPGQIIAGSEEQVRDLFADLRQQAFETGLQMRVNAAEAAFPPSEGPEHGQDQTQ
jgi:hypothetical protein